MLPAPLPQHPPSPNGLSACVCSIFGFGSTKHNCALNLMKLTLCPTLVSLLFGQLYNLFQDGGTGRGHCLFCYKIKSNSKTWSWSQKELNEERWQVKAGCQNLIYLRELLALTTYLFIVLYFISLKNIFRHVSQFWRQVSAGFTLQLGEDWAYGIDLDIFGYSLEKYFEDVGMPDYLDSWHAEEILKSLPKNWRNEYFKILIFQYFDVWIL